MSTKVKPKKKTADNNFSPGTTIKIRSDEDRCQDASFAATSVKKSGPSVFLSTRIYIILILDAWILFNSLTYIYVILILDALIFWILMKSLSTGLTVEERRDSWTEDKVECA